MKRRHNKAKGSVIVVVVLILTVVLLTAGFFVFSKMIKPQKVRYSRDVVSQAKESIIGYAIANKILPSTITDSGAKNVDAWGNALEYFPAGNITASNLCTTEPALLTVNGVQNGAFIVFSKGPDGTNQTQTGPSSFTILPPSDTYDDIAEYINIADLRKKICHEMRITTDSLPVGTEEASYPSTTLEATDGTPRTAPPIPYQWNIVSGLLPPGLSLASGGLISGTPVGIDPRMTRDYTFTVRVVDAEGRETQKQLTLTVQPNEPRITTTFLHYGYKDQSYPPATLSVTGGLFPYTWTALGSPPLPPGLSLSNTGVISGIPTTAGTYTFSATVTDGRLRTASKTLSIVIKPGVVVCPALSLSPPSGTVFPATVGTHFSQSITVSGGQPPITNTQCTPASCNGLNLSCSSSGATISGTPTTCGTCTFNVAWEDNCSPTKQTISGTYTVNIGPPRMHHCCKPFYSSIR